MGGNREERKVTEGSILARAKSETKEKAEPKCEHDWKAVGEVHVKTHIQLVCTKCGEKKEIEQFPF